MPTLLKRSLPENRTLREYGGARLPATFGESMEATIEDPLLRPSQMLVTQTEVAEEEGFFNLEPALRGQDVRGQEDLDRLQNDGAINSLQHKRLSKTLSGLSPLDDVETLNERFADVEGLSFAKPMRRAAAEIIAQGKREENIRRDVVMRGPQGGLAGAARFGVSFAGAAIDPINIASAFIPVVGEARLAGFTARYGVTAARAAKGTAEGLLGAAAVEPLTYGLAQSQQLDYEMSDALINMSLGGLLGGGLHVGGGKIGDFVSNRSPKAREAALRASVAQAAEGRMVDVSAIYRADMRLRSQLESSAAIPGRVFDEGQIRRMASQEAGTATPMQASPQAQTASAFLPSTSKKGGVRVFDTEQDALTATKKMRADVEARPMEDGRFMLVTKREDVDVYREGGELKQFKTERQAEKFISSTKQEKASVIPVGKAGERAYAVAYNLSERDLQSIRVAPEMVEFSPAKAGGEGASVNEDFLPLDIRSMSDNLADLERSATAPMRDSVADFDVARDIAAFVDEAVDPESERAFRASFVHEMREQGLLDEADEALIADAEGAVDRAKAIGRGIEAAAYCVGRRA